MVFKVFSFVNHTSSHSKGKVNSSEVKSTNSWISLKGLAAFQATRFVDTKIWNKTPRAHSLYSSGKSREASMKTSKVSSSTSNLSVKSWTEGMSPAKQKPKSCSISDLRTTSQNETQLLSIKSDSNKSQSVYFFPKNQKLSTNEKIDRKKTTKESGKPVYKSGGSLHLDEHCQRGLSSQAFQSCTCSKSRLENTSLNEQGAEKRYSSENGLVFHWVIVLDKRSLMATIAEEQEDC